jgi:hypothetical protein
LKNLPVKAKSSGEGLAESGEKKGRASLDLENERKATPDRGNASSICRVDLYAMGIKHASPVVIENMTEENPSHG